MPRKQLIEVSEHIDDYNINFMIMCMYLYQQTIELMKVCHFSGLLVKKLHNMLFPWGDLSKSRIKRLNMSVMLTSACCMMGWNWIKWECWFSLRHTVERQTQHKRAHYTCSWCIMTSTTKWQEDSGFKCVTDTV